MPLWQSMQVFSLFRQVGRMHVLRAHALAREVHVFVVVAVAALQRVVRLEASPFVLRQFEPLRPGTSRGVLMVPKIFPQTSFEACILRAIFTVHSCGTWQLEHIARTPERFV